MTKLLYQTDSYLQSFEGQVVALDEENRGIVLDQTAFYPGGGGQPADLGTLSSSQAVYPIVRIKKAGDQVYHFVGGEAPLPAVGESMLGKLDWERRYKLMRTHTALHVLCGVVFRDYGAS